MILSGAPCRFGAPFAFRPDVFASARKNASRREAEALIAQGRVRINGRVASPGDKAGPGDFCFVEDRSVKDYVNSVERVILYRWDRAYPADLFWDLSLEGWTLERREEFPGYSHKIITKEVYVP